VTRGRFGSPLDRRSARVRQTEQAAHLVERLAGRVVHRLAEQPVRQVVAHLDKERVAAAHDERDEREHRLLAFLARVQEPRGVQMTLEVVHADERPLVHERERLREIDPDQQRAGQARAVGHRDRVDILDRRSGILERLVEHRHDPAEVRPGGHLRHDASGRRVERGLARDDVRVDPATVLDERDARLVARRFDGEDQWSAHDGISGAGWGPGASPPGRSSGRVGAGLESSASRRRWIRSRNGCSTIGSVVMISASSPLSL
jgi:hypothetical protein